MNDTRANTIEATQAELAALQAEIEDLRTENARLRDENQRLRDELNKLKAPFKPRLLSVIRTWELQGQDFFSTAHGLLSQPCS